MSLDFYIEAQEEKTEPCECSNCYNVHEHRFTPTLFSSNITHNLISMFDEAGVYEILWRGDGLLAGEQADKLQAAVDLMKADPKRFEAFNATNGWGTYDHALPWLQEIVVACRTFPEGKIRCSR